MEIEITIAVVLLLILGVLSTADIAFSNISDIGLRRLASEAGQDGGRQSKADFLREALGNRPRFRFALSWTIHLLLVTIAVLAVLIALEFYPAGGARFLAVALAGAIVATVLFRQVIPRLIILSNLEKKLLLLLPVVRPIYALAAAISRPFESFFGDRDLQKQDSTVTPETSDERHGDPDEDFQVLMAVGEAEGIIEEDERELIESVVEFNETRAGEIMTPRTEICAVPIESTIISARQVMVEEKYSRLVVYRDSIDNIEGVVYVRDLLQAWAEGREHLKIDSILRDPYFVPETKTAAELLRAMQRDHIQIAIVIDEYGGVAGIVTVEDILEEIVGEIEDEDTEQEEIIEIVEASGGYFDVLGSTEIGKIERLFGMEIEDDDFTTIAGLVTSETGYVPAAGEKLSFRGLDVEVLAADQKKVRLLRLRPASETAETDGEQHGAA